MSSMIIRAPSTTALLLGRRFRALHTSRVVFAAAEPLHPLAAAIATPTRPPTPTTPSASVPFMITSIQRQKLYDLGYNREDVDALSPSDAQDIIKCGLSLDAYSAHVRATWQPRKPQISVEVPEVICLGGEIVGATPVEGKSAQSPPMPPAATASAETPSPLRPSSPSEPDKYRRRRSEEQRPQ